MNKSIVAIEKTEASDIKNFQEDHKFMAHDESNTADVGDVVKIMETRPLSSRKRWRLVEIVTKVK
jgi:small subunit ribosomal protein S17